MIGIDKQISGSKSTSSASVTVAALLAFAVINFACDREEFRHIDTVLTQNVCALRFLLSTESNERVILLGSSVMETPYGIFENGAGYYDTKAKPMERWFARNAKKNIGIANLSVEAATISDQYILVRKYLLERSPMPILVLGVTPRDFIDYRFSEPSDTHVYRTMVDLKDIEIWPDYVKTLGQSFEFIGDKLSVLYRFRKTINQAICAKIKEFPKRFSQSATADAHSSSESPVVLNANASVEPSARAKLRLRASLEEYKLIYGRAINEAGYCRQMSFLERLLKLCRGRNASFLLINMPLRTANRNLMPAGFYKRFLDELRHLTELNKITYIPNFL